LVGLGFGVFGGWGADDEFDGVEDSLAVLVCDIEGIFLHELEGVDLDAFEAEEAEHFLDH